jgi:transposase
MVPIERLVRGSKLDPYKEQVEAWVSKDQLYNCVTMFDRLRPMGYDGGLTILKDFVHPLRPPKGGRFPVQRYETVPGEQMQIDWGTFMYESDGVRRKIYGMTAVLSYSRMRYIVFSKRCDTASLIRAIQGALEYFGGLPRTILSDRMKSVLLTVEDGTLIWNSVYADFLAAIGVAPRVCRSRTPQTKGKVERSIRVIKESFWPGVRFEDVGDLNRQAMRWCEARNGRIHRTTHERPVERHVRENLSPLPKDYAWERFRSEPRRVSWDGFVSFDGVLYGLPSVPLMVGDTVDVTYGNEEILVWYKGQLVVRHAVRHESGTTVWHEDQFKTILPVAESRRTLAPVGYHVPAIEAPRRSLSEYDALFCAQEVTS